MRSCSITWSNGPSCSSFALCSRPMWTCTCWASLPQASTAASSSGRSPCASRSIPTWTVHHSRRQTGYRQMFSGTCSRREPSATWRETDLVSPWQTCPSFTWQCELRAPGKRRHPLGAGRGIILRVVGRSPLPLVLTHCNCPKGESVPATAVPVGFRAFRGGF